MFICGGGSFHHEAEDAQWSSSPGSSPRKAKKRCHNKDCKNPYSTRGLDKFSALLADLEEKKKKIYSQVDSEDISLIRFVYSNSDLVPIVVKSKDKNEYKPKIGDVKDNHREAAVETPRVVSKEVKQSILESHEKPKGSSFSWMIKLKEWKRPSYYLPVIVVLILLLLAVFGRSFAILCTSLGWYVIPNLKESSNSKRSRKKTDHGGLSDKKAAITENNIIKEEKRSPKKKDYVRGISDNKMAVGENVKVYLRSCSEIGEDMSPRKRGHRKSW